MDYSTNSEYNREIADYHRWNFLVNVIEGGFYRLGMNFVSVLTVLPAFLSFLTQSKTVIGLIPSIFVFCWTFPQLISAYHTEHLGKKKRVMMAFRIIYALPWLVLSIYIISSPSSNWMLPVFFILFPVFAVLGGFVVPPWVAFVGKLIHTRKRGRFYGLRDFLGTSFSVIGAFLMKLILERYDFPVNFSVCFILAFGSFSIAAIFLFISKEPPSGPEAEKPPFTEYMAGVSRIVKTNRRFLFFLATVLLLAFGGGLVGHGIVPSFFTVYALERFDLSVGQVGVFTAIILISRLVAGLLGGVLTDNKGPKSSFALAAFFGLLSAGIALISPSIFWSYLVFAFLGFSCGLGISSYHNLIMALSPVERRSTYVGITNTVRAPFYAIAPIVGGLLVDIFSYQTLFITAIVGSIISLVVLVFKV